MSKCRLSGSSRVDECHKPSILCTGKSSHKKCYRSRKHLVREFGSNWFSAEWRHNCFSAEFIHNCCCCHGDFFALLPRALVSVFLSPLFPLCLAIVSVASVSLIPSCLNWSQFFPIMDCAVTLLLAHNSSKSGYDAVKDKEDKATHQHLCKKK